MNIGLTNCAFAVADTNVDEYGFAYVNFTGQLAYPATASVPGFSSDTTAPPSLTVTNVTNSIGTSLGGTNSTSIYNGTSSALPGDVVELDSVSGAAGQFWGDPYGSGPLPLTIEVIDSNGTQAPLNSIDTQGQTSGLLSIVPDVYYPTGTSISCGTTCTPTGNGSPGTYTGGELANNTSGDTWNPSSAGQATDEVIPTEGYNPTANAIEALVPGALTYLVVQPNSAPVNDSPYDIATATCGTQCPLPGTTPITQIGTLSAAAGPGPTSPYPFTIITLSSPLSLSSTIPPGYPLLLNDPSTSTSEVAYTQESMHNGDTTIAVTNADPGNHANGDGTTGEGLDFSYTAGTTVSLTELPNPEGAIGVATGTLASSILQQTITFTSTAPTDRDGGWSDLHADRHGQLGASGDLDHRLDHFRQLLHLGRGRELHRSGQLHDRRQPGR